MDCCGLFSAISQLQRSIASRILPLWCDLLSGIGQLQHNTVNCLLIPWVAVIAPLQRRCPDHGGPGGWASRPVRPPVFFFRRFFQILTAGE